jgi:hypothetical protein
MHDMGMHDMGMQRIGTRGSRLSHASMHSVRPTTGSI